MVLFFFARSGDIAVTCAAPRQCSQLQIVNAGRCRRPKQREALAISRRSHLPVTTNGFKISPSHHNGMGWNSGRGITEANKTCWEEEIVSRPVPPPQGEEQLIISFLSQKKKRKRKVTAVGQKRKRKKSHSALNQSCCCVVAQGAGRWRWDLV